MSGSQQTPPKGSEAAQTAGGTPADPSMEEILASIRRILSEDEPPVMLTHGTDEKPDDVLVLDSSMMVAAPDITSEADPEPEPVPEPEPEPEYEPPPAAVAAPRADPAPVPVEPPPPAEPVPVTASLLAPEAAAAAVASVNSLMRTLGAERSMQTHRGGPTIEDIVREEIRPLLKDWLDTHLPPIVERLVRSEIERVVGRVVP